jgi:hypothetical protein
MRAGYAGRIKWLMVLVAVEQHRILIAMVVARSQQNQLTHQQESKHRE